MSKFGTFDSLLPLDQFMVLTFVEMPWIYMTGIGYTGALVIYQAGSLI